MRFRNSVRLLMENFKHVYKLLLSKLVIALVACALCCAFVLPEIIDIWNSAALQELVENGKSFVKAFFTLNQEELSAYREAIFGEGGSLKKVVSLISSMTLEIVLVCLGCIVVYLLERFVNTLCHFTIGCMLNDKMSTYAETTFSTVFVANLGKASAYSALYVLVVFLFDVVTLALCYFLLAFLPILAALFFSVTLLVVCQSLKLTFTSAWMPAMTVDNLTLKEALHCVDKNEKKQTSKAFSTYLVTVYLVIIVNILAGIFTFGSALLITVPASYMLFICEQYVNYYTMKGKKYFITYERIATNPDHGDSEHFFDYISNEEAENTQAESAPTTEN